MDGWTTWDFTSYSTVFQSYQDDERLIMKGSVQWNLFMVEKILPRVDYILVKKHFRSGISIEQGVFLEQT